MSQDAPIEIVAALIRDATGRVLLVRKRGTTIFMQPGGKRQPGEDDIAALERELREELGSLPLPESVTPLGVFEAPAAFEPGRTVRATLFSASIADPASPQAEIEELIWLDPRSPPRVELAAFTRDHVLPLATSLGPPT